MDNQTNNRKIVHVDMDAFYAAIEIRDNPTLQGKPVAVGGDPQSRGVIATANYEARKFGVHSALSSAMAVRLCPNLTILHPDIGKYKNESIKIAEIFRRFTDIIEPLSLDEAYLDMTGTEFFGGSGTLVAEEIRRLIFEETGLTASAGIAPNKFLAKVASDWNKPNGQLSISPDMVERFVNNLPVKKIPGVGKVTDEKMSRMGVKICSDLEAFSSKKLVEHFGKFGKSLYGLCRGIDNRELVTSRDRKSLSVERTFAEDIDGMENCLEKVPALYEEFLRRLERYQAKAKRDVKALHVKLKFSDFSSTSVERHFDNLEIDNFVKLFEEGFSRKELAVRLIGIGVRFSNLESGVAEEDSGQLTLRI